MELIADFLLVAGALGAGFYCFVLARRLNRFNDLEKGVGGAVAVLSAQVDDLTKTLASARASSEASNVVLSGLTGRAEAAAQRLELLMASLHDIPGQDIQARSMEKMQSSAAPTASEPFTVEPPRPSGGPMFVRHERSANGVTQ
ncbi:MAG: hypothetical protein ACI8R4_000470 [Paracoccaceae bacterium]